MEELRSPNYIPSNFDSWQGRIDGDTPEFFRWYQVVHRSNLTTEDNFTNSVVFLGFCSDEGVARNKGRIGAKDAPKAIRNMLSNLPVHFSDKLKLIDVGDVLCTDKNLEQAQNILSNAVQKIIKGGGFPIVLGGGHEVTFGHYLGLSKSLRNKKIGIINIDAHLDIRKTSNDQGNSGTGFYQISELCSKENTSFHYLALGIQEISNTKALFNFAEENGVQIIKSSKINFKEVNIIQDQITQFSSQVDYVYLTIDMDAFAAPYAPGVSALAFNGIIPDEVFFAIFSTMINLPNLISVDVAEVNPQYDIDNRTARLASSLLFKLINER